MSSAFSVVASEVVVFVKMWTLWKYDNNPQPPLHSTLLYSTLLPQTAQQKISSFVMMSQRKTFISPCRGH